MPRALTDYVKVREGYDYTHHGRAGNPHADFVPDDIVDRFCLLGPAEQHVASGCASCGRSASTSSPLYLHARRRPPATLDAYAKTSSPPPGF